MFHLFVNPNEQDIKYLSNVLTLLLHKIYMYTMVNHGKCFRR